MILQNQQLLNFLHLLRGTTCNSVSMVLLATACRSCLLKDKFGQVINCCAFLPTIFPLPVSLFCDRWCILQATASEVQNLLVSGRKKEALQCAQEGQLWGPALVLASQLGDQVCCPLQPIQILAFMRQTLGLYCANLVSPLLFFLVLIMAWTNAVLC